MRGLFAAVHESVCGTKRTWRGGLTMSAVEGRTDMPRKRADFHFWHIALFIAMQQHVRSWVQNGLNADIAESTRLTLTGHWPRSED